MNRCVIFGAAPIENTACLQNYLHEDDFFVVADGGGRLAAKLGVTPLLTVADHDSSLLEEDKGECVPLPIEKDVTDTRAAMDIAFARGYREFVLLGCLGGRLDHTIANILSARQLTEQGAKVTLVDDKNELTVLLPGKHLLQKGGFSVFSMTEKTVGLTLFGVQYPLADFDLTADNPLCVSNRVMEENAFVCFEQGVLLLVYSKD